MGKHGVFKAVKTRFGYKMKNNNNEVIGKKLGKVRFVYGVEEQIYAPDVPVFQLQSGDVLTEKYQSLEFYTDNQAFAYREGKIRNINFSTGVISRPFQAAFGKYYCDEDKRIFELDQDGNSIYTEYLYSRPVSYKFNTVKNKDGKFILVNNNFEKQIPMEFDSIEGLDIRELDERNGMYYVHDKTSNKLSFVTKDRIIKSQECGNCRIESKKDHVAVYEEDKNLSTVYKIDENSELTDGKVFGGKVLRIRETNADTLIMATQNENNKLYSLESGKTLLENFKELSFGEIKGVNSKHISVATYKKEIKGKEYVGVFDYQNEKDLISPKQKMERVSLEESRFIKENDEFRFFVNNGDAWGAINQKGDKLIDFEYRYGGVAKTYYTLKNGGVGLQLQTKDGKKVCLTLGQDQMLFDAKEQVVYSKDNDKKKDNGEVLKSEQKYKRSEDLQDVLDLISCVSLPLGAILDAVLENY